MFVKVPFGNLPKQYRDCVRDELHESWDDILNNASFILGPQVESFEQAFAHYSGAKYAVGVGSGTDALVLALKALGIGPGAEVITAANSFIATAEAIVHAGATPVFVDMDPNTFTIDVTRIPEAVTARTRAIIPVHLYGQPADMDPICEIANRHDLEVIEDAAQAHGARYHNRKVGCLGKAACFSFYPGKNLGAYGDAGAVVTNDEAVAIRLKKLRDHGGVVKYQHDLLGYSSRLDTLQAAVLQIKLNHLSRWNRIRREYAALYNKLLAGIPGIVTPREMPDVIHVYHLYVIRVEGGKREALQLHLAGCGVQTLIHYPKPITATAPFADLQGRNFPRAQEAAGEILSLPLYPELEREQLEYVAHCIRKYMTDQTSETELAVAEKSHAAGNLA
jgi:dTDP-4-amino-4,6-dideoxygalactose transaminase